MSRAKNMSNPKVTIGIPAYNRPDSLRRAIKSIMDQSYVNLEIIVSDDASPIGDLAEIMEDPMMADQRIRYFRQKKNIGSEANFKFVLAQSTGEYFAWLADDDTIEADFVKELVAVLDAEPDIVLAMCDVAAVRHKTGERWTERLTTIRLDANWPVIKKQFFNYPTSNIFFSLYGLYRTTMLKNIDFRICSRWKDLNTSWEVPFLASIATRGRIVCIDQVLKTYNFNEDSTYHQEIKHMSIIDNIVLGFDVLLRISESAFNAPLSVLDKMRYGLRPWFTCIFPGVRWLMRKVSKN